jgi:glycine/D-amino acid oxidase-like deaminating enzyme
MPMAASAGQARNREPAYRDQPTWSPWIVQFSRDRAPHQLLTDASADVVVVGAGIAGVATAFFVLRETAKSVVLVERNRVARGATGRNAGQMTTYFERPLTEIAAEYGVKMAVDAQRGFEDAHHLLDLMSAEAGATVRVERFAGHMGMFNLHHLRVHLGTNLIRRLGGIEPKPCAVSEDATFLEEIAAEFEGLYSVVPQATVRELLEVTDDRYVAVLSNLAGCANSGLLAQQVLSYLEHRHADRFSFFDHTNADRVVVGDDRAMVHAGGFKLMAHHVVLCTNGFVDHRVEDSTGVQVRLAPDQQITGRVAYMTAFVEPHSRAPAALSYIRNAVIGGDNPYVYVTRRTYDRADDTVTLTCMGGPEYPFHGPVYDPDSLFPGGLVAAMDEEVRPFAAPARPAGAPYDFHWHGLMGYNDNGIRVVGSHTRHPRLLYNLGCNGVGFLPSVYGGHRLSRLLAGDELAPSIFDPREPIATSGPNPSHPRPSAAASR